MTEKSTTIANGQSIHYFEHIPEDKIYDKTIVFVHGNASEFVCWQKQYTDPKLQQYHIIAVDLRGFGSSSYINKCNKIQDWASDIIDLLKIKKVNKILLIGWSFGGAICMKMAEMSPQLIGILLLTSSCSHKGISHQFDPVPKSLQQLFQIAPMVANHSKIFEEKNEQQLSKIFQFGLADNKELAQKYVGIALKSAFKQRCFNDTLAALLAPDINLQNIKSEVLILHGSKDNIIPMKDVEQISKIKGKLQVWQGRGHMIPIQCPKQYNELISKLMENV